jgi:hypothetical protein
MVATFGATWLRTVGTWRGAIPYAPRMVGATWLNEGAPPEGSCESCGMGLIGCTVGIGVGNLGAMDGSCESCCIGLIGCTVGIGVGSLGATDGGCCGIVKATQAYPCRCVPAGQGAGIAGGALLDHCELPLGLADAAPLFKGAAGICPCGAVLDLELVAAAPLLNGMGPGQRPSLTHIWSITPCTGLGAGPRCAVPVFGRGRDGSTLPGVHGPVPRSPDVLPGFWPRASSSLQTIMFPSAGPGLVQQRPGSAIRLEHSL